MDFPTPGRLSRRDRRHSRLDVRARAPEVLAPFSLTAEYRYMDAFDSLLDDDPQRFTIELVYKIPKSNLSIGCHHLR